MVLSRVSSGGRHLIDWLSQVSYKPMLKLSACVAFSIAGADLARRVALISVKILLPSDTRFAGLLTAPFESYSLEVISLSIGAVACVLVANQILKRVNASKPPSEKPPKV